MVDPETRGLIRIEMLEELHRRAEERRSTRVNEQPALRTPQANPEPQEMPSLLIPELPFVVQGFVTIIGSHADGSLVELVEPAWRALLEQLSKDPDALFRLSPRALEELIAASYDADGFDEVSLTPRSGDYGRDVIATKRGRFSIRIIDQVKAYSPGHRVTANDVRALSGVLHADRAATKGIVTTTSTFAPGIASDPSIAPLVPYRLELIDGLELTKRLVSQGARERPQR